MMSFRSRLEGIVDNMEPTTANVHQSLSISLMDLHLHLLTEGPVHIRAIHEQLDHLPEGDVATQPSGQL